MPERTDEQLARSAQLGDRRALETLLERHQNTVFGVAMKLLHNRDDALDSAQEAFLRVCRGLRSYDHRRPFLPWLRKVAVHAALDVIKKRSVRTPAAENPAKWQPDPVQLMVEQEEVRRVKMALDSLSPTERAAFVCKEFEHLDTREIARAMGVRCATVRWYLFEARRKLAGALLGEGCER